ncbi:MFS transporter [Marivirga sp. S37H4]|uniref:MFS transporter n=1 Tax=Marivirga aurantiaca TaxID=2802615 RepID=A0A934X0H6_9BACT|nr:MFS transporter [Marivirga aurantiaca]MBK6266120.1 MFS transporter [Marivirga aurantiaca]
MSKTNKTLAIIVVAQFCCTSVWFAGNAVIDDLIRDFNLLPTALGHLTSSIQLGFITGTLIFAILSIADRFSPSKVFFISAVFAAFFNLLLIFSANTFGSLMAFRFLAGFCLAGIYPVGMKIAADYFDKGLGKSLGYLVGALVLGTAFPHLLSAINADFSWNYLIYATSLLSLTGGALIILFVPDGPFRKASQVLKLNAIFSIFKPQSFKLAAFGYFGHMWELYTFWAFAPLLIVAHHDYHHHELGHIAFLSFMIIGSGALGCVLAGYLANRFSPQKTAFTALAISASCCLLLPLVFMIGSPYLFVGFLVIWGISVVADSPLFSTMVAQNAIPELKGSALTIVNSIGFAITILSIQLLNILYLNFEIQYIFVVLAIGPIAGLVYNRRERKQM